MDRVSFHSFAVHCYLDFEYLQISSVYKNSRWSRECNDLSVHLFTITHEICMCAREFIWSIKLSYKCQCDRVTPLSWTTIFHWKLNYYNLFTNDFVCLTQNELMHREWHKHKHRVHIRERAWRNKMRKTKKMKRTKNEI